MNKPAGRPVSVYVPSLSGGGSEINAMRLASWLVSDGHTVDLVVHDRSGNVSGRIPEGVRVVVLNQSNELWTRLHMLYAASGDLDLFARSIFRSRKQLDKLLYLPALVRYLRRESPLILFSNLWQLAITAVTAKACVNLNMPVVCIFRSAFFNQCFRDMTASKRPRKWLRFLEYCQRVYSKADAMVTVSSGIADDLTRIVGVDGTRVRVIHNPVISDAQAAALTAELSTEKQHSSKGIIIAIGRLSPEKNFSALIRAFASLRGHDSLRLRILGEGQERPLLEALREELGLAEHVELPGWIDDPVYELRRARLFVSTSRWEGFGNAIVEALACGCPVVALDCPHGPREILDRGRYGSLVSVDDIDALTSAIEDALARSVDPSRLQRRALDFTEASSANRYRHLLSELLISAY